MPQATVGPRGSVLADLAAVKPPLHVRTCREAVDETRGASVGAVGADGSVLTSAGRTPVKDGLLATEAEDHSLVAAESRTLRGPLEAIGLREALVRSDLNRHGAGDAHHVVGEVLQGGGGGTPTTLALVLDTRDEGVADGGGAGVLRQVVVHGHAVDLDQVVEERVRLEVTAGLLTLHTSIDDAKVSLGCCSHGLNLQWPLIEARGKG